MYPNYLLKEVALGVTSADDLVPQLIAELLARLAAERDGQVVNLLLKELVIRYAETERRLATLNRQLVQKQLQLDADAQAAAEIQRALLPQKILTVNSADFAWKFKPAELIGGDLFNVLPLDQRHLGIYILDVSGHGVPAAMMSVSVSQALRPASGLVVKQVASSLTGNGEFEVNGLRFDSPSFLQPLLAENPTVVMEALDREFPFMRFEKFFTIFYGVLDTVTGEFRYCNAGHPPPVYMSKDGALRQLTEGGTIIGMGGAVPFEEGNVTLEAGDKIILYTDGILEFQNSDNEFFGEERFHNEIRQCRQQPIASLLESLFVALRSFGGQATLHDDVTLLGFEFQGKECYRS